MKEGCISKDERDQDLIDLWVMFLHEIYQKDPEVSNPCPNVKSF